MKVERIVCNELSFKPGELVILELGDGDTMLAEIVRIVENTNGSYAVFQDCEPGRCFPTTWRPISTYGKTWWKDGERC